MKENPSENPQLMKMWLKGSLCGFSVASWNIKAGKEHSEPRYCDLSHLSLQLLVCRLLLFLFLLISLLTTPAFSFWGF